MNRNYLDKKLDNENIKIFKITGLIGIVITVILTFLTIFSIISFKVILSYIIGTLIGVAMHSFTVNVINKSRVEEYKMVTKKTYLIRQVVYVAIMVLIAVIDRNVWEVLACVGGILSLKVAIYIFIYIRRKNG